MNIYTCVTCSKDFKSERSLRSHLNWHKPGYAEKSTAGAHSSKETRGNRLAEKRVEKQLIIKQQVKEYYLNPGQCIQCNEQLSYSRSNSNFCGPSCSASYHNKRKTPESFERQRASLLLTLSTKKVYNYPKTPKEIKECIICGTRHIRTGKTCSTACVSVLISDRQKENIANGTFNPRLHRNGRRKRSYMEKGFEMWMAANNYTEYQPEHHIKRYDLSGKFLKNYFLDFYFAHLNLAIELDGTQHKLTVEKDQDRDGYLNSIGITVYRIPYTVFQKNEWIDPVRKLLGI